MLVIPFRATFDPFGDVTCSGAANGTTAFDRTSCYATGDPPAWWYAMDGTIDGIFVLDMLVNFRLGFHERTRLSLNSVQMDGRKIAVRYLRLWFWVDLVSVLPWHEMHL